MWFACGDGRLWAEIFEVQEDNGDICWGRVSDDVVPVNITCVQSQPTTVFQITAYNRHVEKIFDVRIIQPGRYTAMAAVLTRDVNPFTADPVKALHFAILWCNPPFLIFDIRALWRSGLSARAPECKKLKMVG